MKSVPEYAQKEIGNLTGNLTVWFRIFVCFFRMIHHTAETARLYFWLPFLLEKCQKAQILFILLF